MAKSESPLHSSCEANSTRICKMAATPPIQIPINHVNQPFDWTTQSNPLSKSSSLGGITPTMSTIPALQSNPINIVNVNSTPTSLAFIPSSPKTNFGPKTPDIYEPTGPFHPQGRQPAENSVAVLSQAKNSLPSTKSNSMSVSLGDIPDFEPEEGEPISTYTHNTSDGDLFFDDLPEAEALQKIIDRHRSQIEEFREMWKKMQERHRLAASKCLE